VSGERPFIKPLGFAPREGGRRAATRKSGDRPCGNGNTIAVGCDGKENDMTTLNQTAAKSSAGLLSIAFVAFVGATVLFLAGHAQSATLHDAAHDMRHATGFPCH